MAPNVVHQNMAYHRNFGENGEICDVNRFARQVIMKSTESCYWKINNGALHFSRPSAESSEVFLSEADV